MKKREKFLLAFLIAIVINLFECVTVEITSFYGQNEIDKQESGYTKQEVEAYSKLLEQYIEGNYGKDYKQLAINITAFEVAGGEYAYETYDEEYIEYFAKDLGKYIEENYGGDYYKLAEERLSEIDEYNTLTKLEDNEYYMEDNIWTLYSFISTSIWLSILIFVIISVEFKNIKQYIKANLKVILIFIILSIIGYVFDEVYLISVNNETLLEYWNNSLKPNIGNIDYWLSYCVSPLSTLIFWMIFIAGNLIKNFKVIKQKVLNKKKENGKK